ncbi:20482_t:CDS:10 [Gigaspora rosea]|nr:20482_t:CDS:10 [Gigaspora rosea]
MPGFDNARQFPQSIEELDFSDIEEKYKVPFEEGFDTIIVVDNAPTVDESKKDKLLKFIRKIFKNAGNIKDIDMPMDPDPKTETLTSKGFLFIEFETPEQAAMAIKQYDGYPMDKTHHLAVNRFTDIEKYSQIEEEYKEPEEEKFEHLRSWLTDPQARDQFVLYRGDVVSIFWNKKTEPPEEVHKRMNWTETYVKWSPLGTYLATFHRQVIALWGGPSWNKIIRFVQSGADTPFGPEDEGRQIIIWDVHGGNLLRSFPSSTLSSDGTPNKITWPMFKWSPSDKYFARVTQGQQGQQGQQALSVYETPSMGLVGNKSIKIEGLVDFDYWTPEIGNQPARVTLLNIPSKEILRTRNLVNVTDCKIHWQSNGDFLCVKVDRHTKTKKSTFSNLEIFRVREKDIPVEVIEVKDVVIAFSWEPKGKRFAIITTSDPNYGQPTQGGVTLKTSVSFYYLEKPKPGKETLEKKTSNAIYWSPLGRHVILATLRSATTFDLEFWDLDFETTLDQKEFAKADPAACLQLMNTQEHYGVTDVEWDPTGRYVITSSSFWRHSIENGYILWDFKGTQLQKHLLKKFKQLLWRPRPKSLLTSEQKKALSEEEIKHRRRLTEEWNAWRKRVEKELSEERENAGIVLPSRRDDDTIEVIEEWIEEVVEKTEEIIDD